MLLSLQKIGVDTAENGPSKFWMRGPQCLQVSEQKKQKTRFRPKERGHFSAYMLETNVTAIGVDTAKNGSSKI